ncbi:MAG: class I SAM-dependent methyltransferase [Ilumatobacter sp.]|nr:class I SAM-dependent methyltransferase [Ilumatobacter sp.]
MIDFDRRRLRSRLEAWLLDVGAADIHEAYGERKAAVIGSMAGTVVELGPGTGANMRYYAPGTQVIAIEPNPVMHDRLRAQAERHGVDLEIRTLRGESIDVDDASADGVVGTLLLCGVDDPAQVVREVHRVLRPGGVYFFIEHVVAPTRTITHTVQRVVRRPHHWLFNGCRTNHDAASLLQAGPFAGRVEFDDVDRGWRAAWVRHQLVGTATRADAG